MRVIIMVTSEVKASCLNIFALLVGCKPANRNTIRKIRWSSTHCEWWCLFAGSAAKKLIRVFNSLHFLNTLTANSFIVRSFWFAIFGFIWAWFLFGLPLSQVRPSLLRYSYNFVAIINETRETMRVIIMVTSEVKASCLNIFALLVGCKPANRNTIRKIRWSSTHCEWWCLFAGSAAKKLIRVFNSSDFLNTLTASSFIFPSYWFAIFGFIWAWFLLGLPRHFHLLL